MSETKTPWALEEFLELDNMATTCKHVRPPLLLFESYVNQIKGEEYLVVHQNSTAWLQLVPIHER